MNNISIFSPFFVEYHKMYKKWPSMLIYKTCSIVLVGHVKICKLPTLNYSLAWLTGILMYEGWLCGLGFILIFVQSNFDQIALYISPWVYLLPDVPNPTHLCLCNNKGIILSISLPNIACLCPFQIEGL